MSNQNKKYTILLVEDDAFLAEVYQTKISLEFFQVELAEDGEKALTLLKKHKPDLVLLDIVLPKVSGFEVLKKIRKLKTFKDTPVILLTNLSQKEDVKKGLALGANDYLIKAHYVPSEIVDRIKKILK